MFPVMADVIIGFEVLQVEIETVSLIQFSSRMMAGVRGSPASTGTEFSFTPFLQGFTVFGVSFSFSVPCLPVVSVDSLRAGYGVFCISGSLANIH